jgi:uncharacterized membrane protein
MPADSTRPSEPTAEEVLAEAERRIAERMEPPSREGGEAPTLSPTARRLVIRADRFIYWLARHWLAGFNVLAFLYVGFSFLAPVLMLAGADRPASVIYSVYRPLCHQLPYRSWYLFGSQLSYTQEELAQLVGAEALVAHGYVGDPDLGYKVALCQRDTAIYGTILMAGVLFAFLRKRVRPMPLWAYLLFGVLPMGLDGGVQFISYVLPLVSSSFQFPPLESTPLRRALTGSLFGLATVWLAYPYVEESFADILDTLERKFGWKQ